MINEHPNVTLIKQLEPNFIVSPDNLFAENFVWRFFNPEAMNLFAEDFVWHFFNPQLPDVQGDYSGIMGLQTLFEKLEILTGGTFQVEPITITPIGDELVIVHVKDRMTLTSRTIELDAVVVWRIVDASLVEAWDIPSVYKEQLQTIK
ncbi:MAG: nuclear transport factor 2 family protein [Cyanobacteria bacterium P01_G01_bin.67]